MTEEEERQRGSCKLTLLEEVQAARDWSKELAAKLPGLELPLHAHLIGIAALLADVATKLEGLKAGLTYDEA